MRRQLLTGLRMTVVLTIILGIIYPLVMTGAGQVLFPKQANGSEVKDAQGKVVGSSLLGQSFTKAQYFHPRPSAAGTGYDAQASSASNLGPTNPTLLDNVKKAAAAYRKENGLPAAFSVPIDAVTSSGSGLDPGISVANARLQAARVADARGLTKAQVAKAIADNTHDRQLGVLGEKYVNVLELNLALDKLTAG